MDDRPATGSVVRVKQVGQSGYAFEHPCFALVRRPDGSQGQVDLEIIQMDRRDYRRMDPRYKLDGRGSMSGFTAPHAHLEPGGDDGDAALARFALMGDRFFVNEDNKDG